jgi:lipopolysaccharide/colanic/teichoic acid biosynthesis glycosyltransferase
VAKANLRLKRPSSHTRLLSRVIILDVVWGGLSPLVAFLLRDGTIQRPTSVATYCVIAFLVSLLVFQWFQTSSPIARFYSIRDASELIKACLLIAVLSAVANFFLTRLEEAPRSIPILHFMLLASGLLGARILLRLRATYREVSAPPPAAKTEHVLIIQATRLAWFFCKMVEEVVASGSHQIVAILDSRTKMRHRSLNGYPIVGAPEDLERVIADYVAHGVRIDTVVLAAHPNEIPAEAWLEVCRVCQVLDIELEVLPERLMPERSEADQSAPIGAPLGDTQILEVELPVSLNRPFWNIKRALDVAVTIALALVLLPVILVVCLLVMFDVGIPVVFWQQRLGRKGAPLHLYKFRTLNTLFDRRTKEKREAQLPSAVGRFLRATRLDEMPQLWNVLSGDMSIIGPRPLLPIDQPQDTTLRLAVRPGLTGWAQICGGRLISVEEKNALDEWYIRHASFRLDAYIVMRTIWMVLAGEKRDEGAIAIALREKTPSAGTLEAAPAQANTEEAEDLSNAPDSASASVAADPPPSLIEGTEAVSSWRRAV